ncbi:MAG: hypothetical protein A4E31_01089 [Methanomassiliicoccales archaeon PtaU1.Bin030]|nr:MAG: hypothetical protein A4E31_01089 [Methanomassiliicoccales archaeon PtaU1.Bin030]
MTSLKHLVIEILQARDLHVVERDGYLFARKGDREVPFLLLTSLDWAKVDDFLARFSGLAGKKVIATLVKLPPASLAALDRSVTVWDQDALEHELGRTRIEGVMGKRENGLVDELMADDFPRMVSPALLEDIRAPAVGERIVRPVVGLDDVKELSRQTVAGFAHRLELVPHFVYGYVCPLYMDGEKVGVEKGALSINSLTHRVESWNDRTEVIYALEMAHRTLEPSIGMDDAKRLARKELVKVNSYEKELIREENNVTIIEKRRVAPREEEIVLEDRGVFYIPIWCVEGVHGIMMVNAGTGKVLSEDYYRI